MSQLTDNLNLIASIKSDIKSAIEAKGVSMTGVSFGSFAAKIGEITTSFVTVPLSVSANGTYNPGQGVDGFSQVVVDVQGTGGIPEKDYTEDTFIISNLNNSASYVASSRFQNYSYLETVTLSLCLSVSAYAFRSCSHLTTVSLPVCRYVHYSAFTFCSSLSSVYLPMLEYASGYTFSTCRSLESIDLPSLRLLDYGVFKSCSALTTVSIPICGLVSGSAFDNCRNLSTITLPSCSVIKEQFNFRSTILNQITLGYSGLCTLNSTDAFTNTPIASGTGSIYVPSSLVDTYKSATNWSAFSSQIFPIPE